ncbi:hypothetical protein [Haliangium ochraceum]|uniref:Uncharacterized protein n=1 Tax=Haliangium ochraceum (strain DSM 14365 / JCM 11303 / SMP-2) TaxID=502025 RepID=D0LMN5_HALO1|nr:hypothetical protein [Haliangium ochraceum]ACY18722.1 conserved hypothetical protein [Haliangium ochraceum DSM 14365]
MSIYRSKPGFPSIVDLLLRSARQRPRVHLRSLTRAEFRPEGMREWHALACRLMAEDFEHFCAHARTNDVVHLFHRADTGALVGFQLWRSVPIDLPRSRAILGGKLRIEPAFRGRALHLLSGLYFFLQSKARSPRTRFYRLSVASLFGFVSLTEALHGYRLLDPNANSAEERAVTAVFVDSAAENHYRVEPGSSRVFVDIRMTADTLAGFGPSYFQRPAARRYAAANPGYRDNGCYVAFWFRFTPANLLALTRAITRKLWRPAAPEKQFAGSGSQ